ncbi:MAG: energy transducer TonB [Cyclobacteriaceae bacterium]|nr:energy transducer TonB [Cyclobacteriaceae bacterium]
MKTSIPHQHLHFEKSLPHSLEANEILTPVKQMEHLIQDLMKIKETKSESYHTSTTLYFFIGLTISLLFSFTVINWKTDTRGSRIDLGQLTSDFDEVMDVPVSQQPPPPPPKMNEVPPLLVEVSNEEVIEEIDLKLDVEVTEETVIEEVIVSFEIEKPVEEKVDEVFTIVENWPTPVGGMEAFYKYIGENISYPNQARRLDVSGLVFMQFVVEKDGHITDIKVVKGIGAGCDEEAIRVLQNAPAWNPGKQRGRPVRVMMTVPIRFVLQK